MKNVNGVWLPDGTIDGWLKGASLDAFGWPLYQRDRLTALNLSCKRHRRFVDGGAHVGLVAIAAARHWARVEAFEPHPDNFACLGRNLDQQAVNRVSARPLALGSAPGFCPLETRKQGSSLSHYLQTSVANPLRGSVTVDVVALDSYGWDDVDAIKLDLEGGENLALEGARETIMRCRPAVLIEEKHDPTTRASWFLRSLGMKCTWSKKNDRLFTW